MEITIPANAVRFGGSETSTNVPCPVKRSSSTSRRRSVKESGSQAGEESTSPISTQMWSCFNVVGREYTKIYGKVMYGPSRGIEDEEASRREVDRIERSTARAGAMRAEMELNRNMPVQKDNGVAMRMELTKTDAEVERETAQTLGARVVPFTTRIQRPFESHLHEQACVATPCTQRTIV